MKHYQFSSLRHDIALASLAIISMLLLFLTVPNFIDASIQAWYCIKDDAPIQSTWNTFIWHLTTY